MRPIPDWLKAKLNADPFMHACIYEGCLQPPEWEHCFTYAGRQINERWAIVPVCAYHHRGAGLDKDFNRYIALTRMTQDEYDKAIRDYPRIDWQQLKYYLMSKYGNNYEN